MKNIPIIFILLFGLSACSKKTESPQTLKDSVKMKEPTSNVVSLSQTQYQSAGITVGGMSSRSLSNVLKANGVIDIPPQNLVSVSAMMGGFVRKTDLLQGMKVRKGQILAIIENPDLIQIQQDYLENESKLEYAELDLKRQTELNKENVNALKVFQLANTEVKTLKARLLGLEERLKIAGINVGQLKKGIIVSKVPIISPLRGSVTAVNVNIGKYVNPTDVMFEIVDTDHLHVELSVFEQDIPFLKLGQLVRFTINNNPDRENLAKVYLINQKINEDRTVRVHCHLLKNDPTLLPQNFVKAIIELGSKPVPCLPDEAIVNFEGKDYIFIKKGTEKGQDKNISHPFEMVEVKKGISENGFTQVDFKDSKNAAIVLKGAYALLSKLKNAEEEE